MEGKNCLCNENQLNNILIKNLTLALKFYLHLIYLVPWSNKFLSLSN